MNKKLIALIVAVLMPLLTFTAVSATGNHQEDNDNHHKPKICKQYEDNVVTENDEQKVEASPRHKKHCKKEEPKPCEFNPQLKASDVACTPPEEPETPEVPEQPKQPETPTTPQEQPKEAPKTVETPQVPTSVPVQSQTETFVDFQGK